MQDVALKAIPQVEKMFEEAVIEFTGDNLLDLVGVMDLNGTGSIDEEEFTHAICTYASGLKSLSIQEVNFNICQVQMKLEQVQDQLSAISSHVLAILVGSASGGPRTLGLQIRFQLSNPVRFTDKPRPRHTWVCLGQGRGASVRKHALALPNYL